MEKKNKAKLSTRMLALLCLIGVGLIVTAIIELMVPDSSLLSMLTVQDVVAFIVPAVAAMALFYRRPLHAMCLDRAPSWQAIAIVVFFYIISLPAMNWLVAANKAMTLPSWMSGIEQTMRTLEANAAETTQSLLNISTIPELISRLGVVGFMAGLSEEMLFRGAMQRTMQDSRLGIHAVVWITAILFSALHMQFFGFVPRMMLGVWLGYLLVWTRSLWVPIIAHTLNNCNVVLLSHLANKGVVAADFGDNLGLPADGAFPWLAIASLFASIAIAVWAHRHYTHCNSASD